MSLSNLSRRTFNLLTLRQHNGYYHKHIVNRFMNTNDRSYKRNNILVFISLRQTQIMTCSLFSICLFKLHSFQYLILHFISIYTGYNLKDENNVTHHHFQLRITVQFETFS